MDGNNYKKVVKNAVKVSLTNFALPAIDLLVASSREWEVPWMIAKGFLLTSFIYQQEKLNWLVEDINSNKEIFTPEILESEEFRTAFTITVEQYLKQRDEQKRNLNRSIFISYTTSDDRSKFEIERFYNTSNLISFEAIELIGFIKKNIWVDVNNIKRKRDKDLEPLSARVDSYFETDSRKIEFVETYANIDELVAELISLGIIKILGYTMTYSGITKMQYTFTAFGIKFIKFIEKKQIG